MQLDSLQALELSGYDLTIHELRILSSSLSSHSGILAISMRSCGLCDPEGLAELSQALSPHPSLETLDLSGNHIDDLGAVALASLVQSTRNLKAICLDNNLITGKDLAVALGRNETIERFEISGNPLEFESVIAFLELLASSRSLTSFSAENCPQQGPAPFKENSSGHLSKPEAVLLVLSCVLRYSPVQSLALDIDIQAEMQLQELANVLVKHNRSLISLRSSLIDPNKVPMSHPLHTIYQALKANLWLAENEMLPKDQRNSPESALFDLISKKQMYGNKRISTPDSSFSESSRRPVSVSSPRFAEESFSAEKNTAFRTERSRGSREGLINLETYRAVRLKKTAETKEIPEKEGNFPYNALNSCENPHSDIMKMLEMLTSSLHRLEIDTSRSVSSLISRLSTLEDRVSQQGSELLGCKDRFEGLDETVGRLESREQRGEQGNIWKLEERMAAIERREAAKLTLFEELGKDMDVTPI